MGKDKPNIANGLAFEQIIAKNAFSNEKKGKKTAYNNKNIYLCTINNNAYFVTYEKVHQTNSGH